MIMGINHKATGKVTSCKSKPAPSGGHMTSFRFDPKGSVYYIAMHYDVLNPEIIRRGEVLYVEGEQKNAPLGVVFMKRLEIGETVIEVRTPDGSCSTCGGSGFHEDVDGVPVTPCATCGLDPKITVYRRKGRRK